jgi:hypothetical protein
MGLERKQHCGRPVSYRQRGAGRDRAAAVNWFLGLLRPP